MPKVQVNGVSLFYEEFGAGDQTVVFSHSYLADYSHFQPQIDALASSYRVIAYDHRDHGKSELCKAPYTIDALVEDAAALITEVGAGPCHFVGLSTGGFVGTRLAIRHRNLLRSLVLMDTSGQAEPAGPRTKYKAMMFALRFVGMKPLVGSVMKSLFGQSTLRDPAKKEFVKEWRARLQANDSGGLIRFGNAIFGRDDIMAALAKVDIPTLVMVGAEDLATPPIRAKNLASTIPGARLEIIPNAGHLNTVEQPDAVNAALLPFIESVS